MKKILIFNSLSIFIIIGLITFFSNCVVSDVAMDKSGAQLWGENCIRCHNTPSPETFSDTEWDVAVMHMRVRANLTDNEAGKIVSFLKTAN